MPTLILLTMPKVYVNTSCVPVFLYRQQQKELHKPKWFNLVHSPTPAKTERVCSKLGFRASTNLFAEWVWQFEVAYNHLIHYVEQRK